jgi:hypothetical protein
MIFLVDKNKVKHYTSDSDYTIPTDSINAIPFGFVLSSDWEGYTLTSQITKADKTVNILLDKNNAGMIPPDMEEGIWNVSLFGVKDGSKRNTTIPATLKLVKSGYNPQGQPPIQPPEDLYAKLIKQIEEANKIAQSVRDDADAGKFDGKDGADGVDGKSAYELAVENGFVGTEQEWLESLRYDHSEEFTKLAEQVKQDSVSASNSAQAASQSATNAASSEVNAKRSENASKQSEDNAKQSETNAEKSAEAAKLSETNAKASETEAKKSAESAKQSADYAAESVDNIVDKLAIKLESKEETHLIQDSIDYAFDEFFMYGKSIQQTTTGAQLIDINSFQKNNNFSVKIVNNYSVELTSTVEKDASDSKKIYINATIDADNLVGKTITISYDEWDSNVPNENAICGIRYNINGKTNFKYIYIYGYIDSKMKTITIPLGATECKVRFFLTESVAATVKAGTYTAIIKGLMFCEGIVAKSWEPYTEGNPSPSPEYKQEPVSSGQSGQIKTDVLGGNLLDLSKGRSGTGEGVTYIKNPDGSYRRTGKATESYGNVWFLGKYSIDPNLQEKVLFTLKQGTYTVKDCVLVSNKEALQNTFTIDSDFKVTGVRNPSQVVGQTYNDVLYPMLNVGSSALPFEPYKQSQTLILTTPDGLLGIPVSGDDYTYIDSTGQKWIADSIEYRRDGKCVRVQRVKKEVFTNASGYDDKEKFMSIYSSEVLSTGQRVKCISDRFVYKSSPEKDEGIIFAFEGVIRLYKNFSGIDEANEWLTKNPVTVIYPLANHIETPLTPEEIAAFKVLHTNEPTTTIMNDAGITTKVKYITDTKKYIDSKFVTLAKQLIKS